MLLLGVVGKCVKISNLVKPSHAIQGVQIMGIGGSELPGLQIASPQIFVFKSVRCPGFEKMETKPTPVRSGDPLRLAKKGHKQQQHEIGIDHALKFEVSRKILAIDPPQSGS